MDNCAFEAIYREMLPFWNDVSEEDRSEICGNSAMLTYAKGTTIHDGSECSGVFFCS